MRSIFLASLIPSVIVGRMTFNEFFRHALGLPHDPYPYQRVLAEGDWPKLIDVPTGMGKTASVIVGWLYKRYRGDVNTPRRLVYCLPMRVLVEQTHRLALTWVSNTQERLKGESRQVPSVHLLMGGEVDAEWEEHPESPAIFIGTQDMLLSRALNRGYAMSRYKWPVHFGLLHNDALWVFDETQIMGVAVETSAQLEGLRRRLGNSAPTRTVWMSATLGQHQFATVDHPRMPEGWTTVTLTPEDEEHDAVRQRIDAQ